MKTVSGKTCHLDIFWAMALDAVDALSDDDVARGDDRAQSPKPKASPKMKSAAKPKAKGKAKGAPKTHEEAGCLRQVRQRHHHEAAVEKGP